VEHIVLLDRQLEELEQRIGEKLMPFREQYELIQTIPGIKEATGASILAEIGADMDQFETAKHLCSWSGICPGNNRSAGKSKHSRIKKGNKFLLAALAEAGWGAARTSGSIFQRKFHRWVTSRIGKGKANIAIARSLLTVVYAVLKQGRRYEEPDPKHIHELEKAKLIRHHSKRLRDLGADEELIAQILNKCSEPPATGSSPEKEPVQKTTESPERSRRNCPAKVCRGALGFRARQTRQQEYSVFKERSAGAPSQGRPKSKRKSKTDPPKQE
jgi:Transposase IS116/IS110/IS902 family